MTKVIELTGLKFGRLTVRERAENSKDGRVRWSCECKCGGKAVVRSKELMNRDTRSCGCLKKENASKRFTTHGLRHHPLYSRWLSMKDRCFNANNKDYIDYGGRGITVCQEWRNDFQSFYDFCIEEGWKKELELDRRDNDGNYGPNNLRFIARQENVQNTRSCKLDKYKVRRIREFLSVGIGVRELARVFNLKSHKSITQIRDGKSWANI